MATIQQVTKQAGVSVATVSRSTKRTKYRICKTRMKVDDTIKKLCFVNPESLGRKLRNAK
jgi:DNA-binding LacI/PurR family transcriptional regulator